LLEILHWLIGCSVAGRCRWSGRTRSGDQVAVRVTGSLASRRIQTSWGL